MQHHPQKFLTPSKIYTPGLTERSAKIPGYKLWGGVTLSDPFNVSLMGAQLVFVFRVLCVLCYIVIIFLTVCVFFFCFKYVVLNDFYVVR